MRGGQVVAMDNAGNQLLAVGPGRRSLLLSRGELLFECDLGGGVVRCFTGAARPLTSLAVSPDSRVVAAGSDDRLVRLWDGRTGAPRATLAGHRGKVLHTAFSPDGRRLLSASLDGTVIVWDVAEALRLAPAPAPPASRRPAEALWADLASEDAGVAAAALDDLEAQPQRALAVLVRHMRPVAEPPAGLVARLVGDLDAPRAATREKASVDLDALGDVAVGELRNALASPSAEVRKRAGVLLARHGGPVVTGPAARPLRAVELLERIGSDEARKLLTLLAGGAREARLTQHARSSLERHALTVITNREPSRLTQHARSSLERLRGS